MDVNCSRGWNRGLLARDALALQHSHQLPSYPRNVVLNRSPLRWQDIGRVSWKGCFRGRAIKNALDFGEEPIDVLASDPKPIRLEGIQRFTGFLSA
jgi:hypothetical protein